MSAETLKKLLDLYPDLCANWLLRGEGSCKCARLTAPEIRNEGEAKDVEIAALKELMKSKDDIIELLRRLLKK